MACGRTSAATWGLKMPPLRNATAYVSLWLSRRNLQSTRACTCSAAAACAVEAARLAQSGTGALTRPCHCLMRDALGPALHS